MELKKGYKSEELTGFFKECYRTGKRARKTADGGWTDEDLEIPAQSNNESYSDATEQIPEAPSEPGTEKKGAWKRFKSFFTKKE